MNILNFLLFGILPLLVTGSFAGYLLYARYHPEIAERSYKKHEALPKVQGQLRRLYSGYTLISSLLITFLFLVFLAVDIYEYVWGKQPAVTIAGSLLMMLTLAALIYCEYRSRTDKEGAKKAWSSERRRAVFILPGVIILLILLANTL